MTTTTLVIVPGPTLHDSIVQLLHIGDALQAAGDERGVVIYHDEDWHPLEAEPDSELPAGVLEYVLRLPVDPWAADGRRPSAPTDYTDQLARLELLELLATLNPGRDVLATADGVGYLS